MIQDISNKSKKELVDIVKIQQEEYKKLLAERTKYYDLYCELLFSPFEPPKNLEAHNLKQQAKGLSDWAGANKTLAKRTKPSTYIQGAIDMQANATEFSEDLRSKAAAIKDNNQ